MYLLCLLEGVLVLFAFANNCTVDEFAVTTVALDQFAWQPPPLSGSKGLLYLNSTRTLPFVPVCSKEPETVYVKLLCEQINPLEFVYVAGFF
jgi:hypothetical protein